MSNRTAGRTPAPPSGASSPEPPKQPKDRPSATGEVAHLQSLSGHVVLAVGSGEPPEHLFRHLLSAYLSGARSFEVVERPRITPRTRQVVEEFCRRTRQPEIVRGQGSVLEVVDLDVGDPAAFDRRLGELGERVAAFHEEATASWADLPFGDDGQWDRKDDDIDREAWYLERALALGRAGGSSGTAAAAAWTVVRSLERIADHAVTLGEVGPRLADLREEEGLLRELRQFHRQAMGHLREVLGSADGRRSNELLDVGEALIAGGQALAERLLPAVGDGSMTPASAAAVARALEAIRRTVAYSQDIAQAFFDRGLRFGERRAVASVPHAVPRVAIGPGS
jgi:hypothetical protein